MREQVYARCKIHLQRFQLKAAKAECDGFDDGLPTIESKSKTRFSAAMRKAES